MARRFFATHDERCYTTAEVIEKLSLPRRTFYLLKAQGRLPLDELKPRLGRSARFRAAPIDRYLAGRGEGRKAS